MEVLDKKGRLFGLINPIDLVAIILAFALGAVLLTVLFGRSPIEPDISSGPHTIEVVFLGSTPSTNTIRIAVGDTANRLGSNGVMGTVTSYTVQPFKGDAPISGRLLMTNEVKLVIRGRGSITDTAASIGDERVRQGQQAEIQLPLFQIAGRIISVEKVD